MKKIILLTVLVCMLCSAAQVWALEEDEGKEKGNTGVLILTQEEAARERERMRRESCCGLEEIPETENDNLPIEDQEMIKWTRLNTIQKHPSMRLRPLRGYFR